MRVVVTLVVGLLAFTGCPPATTPSRCNEDADCARLELCVEGLCAASAGEGEGVGEGEGAEGEGVGAEGEGVGAEGEGGGEGEGEGRNTAPTASDGAATTNEDGVVEIPLGASDDDGDALTFAIVAAPAHGIVVIGSGLTADVATYVPQ